MSSCLSLAVPIAGWRDQGFVAWAPVAAESHSLSRKDRCYDPPATTPAQEQRNVPASMTRTAIGILATALAALRFRFAALFL